MHGVKEVLSVRNYRVGYRVEKHLMDGAEWGGEDFEMRSAFTASGQYIGNPVDAHRLIVKRGIMPEYAREDSNVCSIGFCEKDQKWYGWSHRALYGFGIGGWIYEEEWEPATDQTPFNRHGDVQIETLDQAKQAAINFARSVS